MLPCQEGTATEKRRPFSCLTTEMLPSGMARANTHSLSVNPISHTVVICDLQTRAQIDFQIFTCGLCKSICHCRKKHSATLYITLSQSVSFPVSACTCTLMQAFIYGDGPNKVRRWKF